MNRLDHVVTDKINTNKDQRNEAIYNGPTFDISIFNSYSGTRDPLRVVTVALWVCKKHTATTVSGLTFF